MIKPKTISLEQALESEIISDWIFYEAVTGYDWFNKGLLPSGEVHPFKFNDENREQIYELVKKLERSYQENYDPEDPDRQYYEQHFSEIKETYELDDIKKQKEAIRGLLSAIVSG